MRRPAVIAFLAVSLLALAAAAVLGARERRTLAFTLGVPSFGPVARLGAGEEACQQPILPSDAFDAVELQTGTPRRPGGPLAVTVRRTDGALLGRGTFPAARPGQQRRTVAVGRVDTRGPIAVCVRNAGTRAVALDGGPDVTARTSSAHLGDRALGADLDLVFRRDQPRSTLTLLPAILRRAALFRAGWIDPWLYWLLLAGAVIAVPALLARALARASLDESGRSGAD
jgi:hypothetical protein